jgi:thiol-disulfide isomerase/thioredoxin
MLQSVLRALAIAFMLIGASLPALADVPFEVGDEPPRWLGIDTDGEDVHLADYADRVRVVSFWATWCGPCLTELDVLEQLQAQIDPGDLRIVAINILERNQRRVRRMLMDLDESELRFTSDWKDRLVDEYDIDTIPLMMMIDHRGAIRHVHQGYGEEKLDQIVDELNALLVEQARDRRAEKETSAP